MILLFLPALFAGNPVARGGPDQPLELRGRAPRGQPTRRRRDDLAPLIDLSQHAAARRDAIQDRGA